jgi:hypothetical protein
MRYGINEWKRPPYKKNLLRLSRRSCCSLWPRGLPARAARELGVGDAAASLALVTHNHSWRQAPLPLT